MPGSGKKTNMGPSLVSRGKNRHLASPFYCDVNNKREGAEGGLWTSRAWGSVTAGPTGRMSRVSWARKVRRLPPAEAGCGGSRVTYSVHSLLQLY